MAKATKRTIRRAWTTQDVRELKQHSKSKTPVKAVSKAMKRTPAAVRWAWDFTPSPALARPGALPQLAEPEAE